MGQCGDLRLSPREGQPCGLLWQEDLQQLVSLKGCSLVRDLSSCFGPYGNCCLTTGNQPWPSLASGPVWSHRKVPQSCRRCWESQNNLLGAPQGTRREGGTLATIRALAKCINQSLWGCLLRWARQDSLGLGLVSKTPGWRAAPCWCRAGRQASWWLA